MIFFTADLHFFHDKIITHCQRPFANADKMNQKLICNWNNVVQPDDEVYILGDVTLKGPDAAYQILSQLRGKKYLIRGNHDGFVDSPDWQPYAWTFTWVKDYAEVEARNQLLVLCHYPFADWNQRRKGAIHLHGHQHHHADYNLEQRRQHLRRYDVGVDANHYTPVSLETILAFMIN
ncbi:metallophosphoesterase [Megasphaera elsdenii]